MQTLAVFFLCEQKTALYTAYRNVEPVLNSMRIRLIVGDVLHLSVHRWYILCDTVWGFFMLISFCLTRDERILCHQDQKNSENVK